MHLITGSTGNIGRSVVDATDPGRQTVVDPDDIARPPPRPGCAGGTIDAWNRRDNWITMSTQTGITASTRSAGYTAVVHYPAPAGDAAARDVAVEEVLHSAEEHEGHLGSVVLRGGSPDAPELYLVVSFNSHDSWAHWQSSEPAQRTIARLEQVTGASPDGYFVDSMAGWFNLPGLSGLRTPPKWKTAVVSFITLVPVLFVIQYLTGPLTADLDPVVSLLLISTVMIPLITYVAMPFMTRLLRGWLYPQTNIGLTESTPSVQRGRATRRDTTHPS